MSGSCRPTAVLLVLLVFAGGMGTEPSTAAESGSLSRATHEKLIQYRKWMEEGKLDRAEAELEKLLNALPPGKDYSRAVTYETLGYARAQAGRFGPAAEALRRALAAGAYEAERAQQVRSTLARVQLNAGRYTEAEATLQAWLDQAAEPDPRLLALLGHARLRQSDFGGAVAPLEQAVAAASTPKASWLRSLLKAYLETEALDEAISVQRRLIERSPEKDRYWRNLASLYLRTERREEVLAVAGLTYLRDGDLAGQRRIWLARLYLQEGRPLRAGAILAKALEAESIPPTEANLRLLARAWRQAKERQKAVDVLHRLAEKTGDPGYWVQAARLELARGDWQGLEKAAQRALESEQLENRGRVLTLLGIGRFRQDELASARKAFETAARATPDQGDGAEAGWIDYLDALEDKQR